MATFEQIDKEIGNVVGQKSAGSRLRNLQQVVNAQRRLNLTHGKSVNHLTEAMELILRSHGHASMVQFGLTRFGSLKFSM